MWKVGIGRKTHLIGTLVRDVDRGDVWSQQFRGRGEGTEDQLAVEYHTPNTLVLWIMKSTLQLLKKKCGSRGFGC